MAAGPRIQASNIQFSYKDGKNQVQVLDNVSLTVHDGEYVSILGPSGCGKTTLLNMIAGITKPDSGTAMIDGELVHGINLKLAYVYQKDVVLPWYTVTKNLELGLKFRNMPKELRVVRTNELLTLGNFQNFASFYPHQLSGGMRRKLGLLMALAVKPEILLLDEPFFGLDQYTKTLMHAEVLRLWETVRGTWIMVTHDIDEAIALSDRVIVMSHRPSHIKKVFDVNIPRPRDAFTMRSHNDYLEIYREVWETFQGEFRAQ
jgi:NitT/TauT family transport system ATP-binding protein